MPRIFKRFTENIHVHFKRKTSVSGGDCLETRDEGKRRAEDIESEPRPAVIPELAHLVDATPLNSRLMRKPVPFNPTLSQISEVANRSPEPDHGSQSVFAGFGGSLCPGSTPESDSRLNYVKGPELSNGADSGHSYKAIIDYRQDPHHEMNLQNSGGPSNACECVENSGHLNADETYTLLPPSNPSTPETHTQHIESTLYTASKLISSLHIAIDQQREDVSTLRRELDQREGEIADLKIALDFGNKLLGTTYRRQWKLWQWVENLSMANGEKQRLKLLGKLFSRRQGAEEDEETNNVRLPEEFEWENFGHGPDNLGVGYEGRTYTEQSSNDVGEALGIASLHKDELGNILRMAENNVRALKEGVAEMVALVQACKRQATGIQEAQESEV
ncbi:hypothetical protein AOQ84DRAFT_387123 [Glonium stellatum]|uniref:Uncharacterized protein n=1 Tax=Glonium stellatum TaxID=574774 RepID=A0A8E2F663_9PEZI|nr:hypothetical protein AOQ84DRAFT_387123 [Glonium stellatum]